MFEAIMRSAKQDLEDSLGALYPAFLEYPFPSSLDASPLRDAEKILAALKSAPLREIDATELGRYAASAITTVGSADDFKHFLPRIPHCAVLSPSAYGFEPPIIASKLLLCDWQHWPIPEQIAVANFVYSAWAYKRLQDPDFDASAWDWIMAMAKLDLQFEACLSLWVKQPTPNAFVQLAGVDLKSLYRGGGFWQDVAPEKRHFVVEWLKGDVIENAFIGLIDAIPPQQHWIVDCLRDEIRELQRLPSRVGAPE
ncbi:MULTISPECIES: hypothetical protein [Rhizobium]|uniref:Uncharacterized protein n=1 Tax=Rhizobium leguminosarum bv. viciae TaxID=387 RepID=A0A8G2MTP2_RHILV|nr:hypothetical protein [Rhizobium leguminosarum]MBY5319425.1 hypothetical protein [Rhizobium leguminosarum]MBY5380346.1 hypothetical protein [Rhizobium leguminosarum]MBY5421877.1 hypothetical protein [Rhizobium leguminosarum]MCA2430573.1 hypothetical protein [Rhizobium leguminosarum]NEH40458.1 hypothetical protein [Rhizobium leguminosarum]